MDVRIASRTCLFPAARRFAIVFNLNGGLHRFNAICKPASHKGKGSFRGQQMCMDADFTKSGS